MYILHRDYSIILYFSKCTIIIVHTSKLNIYILIQTLYKKCLDIILWISFHSLCGLYKENCTTSQNISNKITTLNKMQYRES